MLFDVVVFVVDLSGTFCFLVFWLLVIRFLGVVSFFFRWVVRRFESSEEEVLFGVEGC